MSKVNKLRKLYDHENKICDVYRISATIMFVVAGIIFGILGVVLVWKLKDAPSATFIEMTESYMDEYNAYVGSHLGGGIALALLAAPAWYFAYCVYDNNAGTCALIFGFVCFIIPGVLFCLYSKHDELKCQYIDQIDKLESKARKYEEEYEQEIDYESLTDIEKLQLQVDELQDQLADTNAKAEKAAKKSHRERSGIIYSIPLGRNMRIDL